MRTRVNPSTLSNFSGKMSPRWIKCSRRGNPPTRPSWYSSSNHFSSSHRGTAVVVPVIRDTWVWSKVRIHSSRALQTQLSMPRDNPVGCSIQCLRERKTVKIDTPSIITQTMLSSKQRSTILVTACTFKISTALRVRLLTPTLKKERRRPMEFSPISNLL